MTRLIILFILISSIPFSYSQAKLEVAANKVTIGTLLNNKGRFVYELPIYNKGNEPLIISRARTGDGGSMANYDRNPIMPGDSGIVEFIYDTKRIGPINRSMYIESNGGRQVIRFKGVVVYQPTEIFIENPVVELGDIHFGETAKATFFFKNAGQYPLAISSNVLDYFENDLTFVKFTIPNAVEEKNYGHMYPPGTRLQSTIILHNTYGNTGRFERKIKFLYNSVDTLTLTIRGNYSGAPWKNNFISEKSQLFYQNNQLYKKETYNNAGDIIKVMNYSGGHCTKVSSKWDGELKMLYTIDQGRIISSYKDQKKD